MHFSFNLLRIKSFYMFRARNIPGAVCGAPPEDEKVMLEICRGPWFSINWIKSASRWFHYTDIVWCMLSKTLKTGITITSMKAIKTHWPGEKLISIKFKIHRPFIFYIKTCNTKDVVNVWDWRVTSSAAFRKGPRLIPFWGRERGIKRGLKKLHMRSFIRCNSHQIQCVQKVAVHLHAVLEVISTHHCEQKLN
jgi:hypothetical protein